MIHAYRKPLDPSTLVIEIEGTEDAGALRTALNYGGHSPLSEDLIYRLGNFLDGDEMSPEAEDGPYRAEQASEGWLVSTAGWGIGYSFARESIAREAAATLNELVKLDKN